MYDLAVKKVHIAISSPDEFLVYFPSEMENEKSKMDTHFPFAMTVHVHPQGEEKNLDVIRESCQSCVNLADLACFFQGDD